VSWNSIAPTWIADSIFPPSRHVGANVMAVRTPRRTARSAGREAASSRWLQWLARGGLIARGVNYMLVGLLAVQIALGAKGKQADTAGALHEVASQPGGLVVLWLLAAGFAGLTLWRLAEAAYGSRDGRVTRRSGGCSPWHSESSTALPAPASLLSSSAPAARPPATPRPPTSPPGSRATPAAGGWSSPSALASSAAGAAMSPAAGVSAGAAPWGLPAARPGPAATRPAGTRAAARASPRLRDQVIGALNCSAPQPGASSSQAPAT
jgi:hypothetical protein